MGFFDKFVPKEIRKPFEKAARVVRKVTPRELRPALPFLAAATPFLLPARGIASLPFYSNPALQRGILSSLANIGSQEVMDPEGDINLLSAAMAGLTGAGTTEGFGDTLRGMTTKGSFSNLPAGGATMPELTEKILADRGFFTKAADLGLTGAAKAADFLGGSRETLEALGSGEMDLFSKAGAKAAAKAAAVPVSQGTGDLAYATASKAMRDFEEMQAEELRQAGLSETEMMLARRNAITEAMTDALFEEEDINATLDELGLLDFAEGGRVGYKTGKLVKEGLGALKLFRRPKYRFEDEAKMTLDLTKTGRYTEEQLLELDGDQIAEIYEYEGFTPPAPIEGSTKIIDMEEILENIKNVTPEDKADGGITGLKDGGMLDFGGKEMDLRGGGFVPIGKKEKADDVPARLSKNEFVMTADAVRAAGGGSVNKGAQRMYNLMNNLEARA